MKKPFFCIPRNNNKTYTEKPHTVSENKRATIVISATIRKIMTTTYCLMKENCWNYSEQCWRKAQFQKQNNTPLPPPQKNNKTNHKKPHKKAKHMQVSKIKLEYISWTFPYTHANQEDFDTTTCAAPSQHPHDDQKYPQPDQCPCQTTDHAGQCGDVFKGFQHRGYKVSSHDNQRPGGDQRQSDELKQSRNVCRFRKKFSEFKGISFCLFWWQNNQFLLW